MKIFKRAKKAGDNKKGFTLVELIVVLVILAILAAMLLPALLGWIDEARNKQYVLEARSVYMAAQAVADEKYASGEDALDIGEKDVDKIQKLADVALVGTSADGDLQILTSAFMAPSGSETSKHDEFTIAGMEVQFQSKDGKFVDASLVNGEWTVVTGDDIGDIITPP